MMSMTIKTAALAFTAMAGIGAAVPLAVYLTTTPPAPTTKRVAPDDTAMLAPAPAMLRAAAVLEMTDLQVQAPKPAVKARRTPAPAQEAQPVARCGWHANEALSTGRVWVCDVDRTSNDRPRGTFKIDKRNERLAPRDAPSPSGFIEP